MKPPADRKGLYFILCINCINISCFLGIIIALFGNEKSLPYGTVGDCLADERCWHLPRWMIRYTEQISDDEWWIMCTSVMTMGFAYISISGAMLRKFPELHMILFWVRVGTLCFISSYIVRLKIIKVYFTVAPPFWHRRTLGHDDLSQIPLISVN